MHGLLIHSSPIYFHWAQYDSDRHCSENNTKQVCMIKSRTYYLESYIKSTTKHSCSWTVSHVNTKYWRDFFLCYSIQILKCFAQILFHKFKQNNQIWRKDIFTGSNWPCSQDITSFWKIFCTPLVHIKNNNIILRLSKVMFKSSVLFFIFFNKMYSF